MSLSCSSLKFAIHEPSQVGEARRAAHLFAGSLGFDEETIGRIAIVATEAGRNLHLHAGGGELIFTSGFCEKQLCFDLLAVDKGPGMDLSKCMRDGYSTAGTPGTGLGAITRLADRFDIHSAPGQGTVMMTRFYPRGAGSNNHKCRLEVSAASLAHPGEHLCGDAWAALNERDHATFMLADGLGHGPQAEEAAQEAVRIFKEHPESSVTHLLERMHAALRSTRGAAVAIARIDLQKRELRFGGVGNISAGIITKDTSRSLVSLNGTIGHHMHRIQEFLYPWSDKALLIMHSDGLTTKWDLHSYAGLAGKATGVVAGVLYRDFNRGRDDVTVVVARHSQPEQT